MFQVLALCQSETDAGAHWQMVMKLFFLFADQIGRALGMFSKRQERVSIISFQFFYKERGDSKLVCTNCQRFVS